jgi:hypothetical protein
MEKEDLAGGEQRLCMFTELCNQEHVLEVLL